VRRVNLIMLFNNARDRVLMCVRRRDPYAGLSNFVGGKVCADESGLTAAYRELFEETGVTEDDVALTHMIDYHFRVDNVIVEVYVGALRHEKNVFGNENELYWCDLGQNFFDVSRFAGEGNVGHMIELVKYYGAAVFMD